MAHSSTSELTQQYRSLAKQTLNEVPERTAAHLISFKRWLKATPHLTIPDNDVFLLSFLRYAHYDHSLAQKRVDNYCTLRSSTNHDTYQWFAYPPIDDPVVTRYLEAGIMVNLGFTQSGMCVVLVRLKCWSPESLSPLDLRILNNMMFEQLILDERVQIGGICLFIDMAEVDIHLAKAWADVKDTKRALKLMQEASPGRVKHLIFYKESAVFNFAFKLVELWVSSKMRSRFIRTKGDTNKAFKKVHGLKEVMPKDYGGTNSDIAGCIEKSSEKFKKFFEKPSPLHEIRVDESKRPSSAMNYMKAYQDAPSFGTPGTFIKFDPS